MGLVVEGSVNPAKEFGIYPGATGELLKVLKREGTGLDYYVKIGH